jgi:hypothetical protein
MNPCWGTAPQKRPDPGHNAPPWGCAPDLGGRALKGIAVMDICANTRSATLVWSKRLKQAAQGAACALMLLAAAQGTARAEDDDDQKNSIWNLDTRVYREFMSALGWRNGSEESIEYRERSPLVVPPSRSLPAPEAARVQPNPAWPVDPDQKRRKEAAATKAKRKTTPYDPDIEAGNLMPSELNRSGPGPVRTGSGRNSDDPEGTSVAPSQLGYFGGLFSWSSFGFGLTEPKEEVGTFTREPPRAALTAPPVGYQTPSPAAPYGVTKRIEYGKTAKPDLAVDGLSR